MSMKVVEADFANIVSEENLANRVYAMTESWRALGVDQSAIGPILRFMEVHSDWDFGAPGQLVHFVEQFLGQSYEEELTASVRRSPTAHTLWMLNRIVNGEQDRNRKAQLVELMAQVASTPGVNLAVADEARAFVASQKQKNGIFAVLRMKLLGVRSFE